MATLRRKVGGPDQTGPVIKNGDGSEGGEERSPGLPGIVRGLGDLPPGAIVTEAGLAAIFGKHPSSIRRAVERGELPPPTRLMGKPSWTVGAIIRHIEKRLEAAAEDAAVLAKHAP